MFIQKKQEIKNVCVIGSGFMGMQIEILCAIYGYKVTAHDISQKVLDEALKTHQSIIQKLVSAKKKSQRNTQAMLNRITYTTDIKQAVAKADIVIESVPEDLDLKRKVFSELDRLCPPHTIIATGASVFKVSSLENVTQRKKKLLNMHFYPPIWERPVVELMGGTKTSKSTIETAKRFVRSMDLVPLVVKKEIAGFLFNRIWGAIKNEALFLVDGRYTSFEDIDRAWMINTGMKIGPFGLMDMVGLDVIYKVCMAYYKETQDEREKPPKILIEKVKKGELGVKTQKGFYSYPNPAYQNPNWLKKGSD
ncbi:MAG: hypothetical protein B6D55_00810 [Candidatus Omnitrophica bacterium 4484_70.2]|nr:MAG: hypothetical protein B6D55_00810 [Candidatus Omnitrophica bacterium 4484_70.2]